MNSRTTVLLLLVLAALGGAAWFLQPSGDVDPWAKPTEHPSETQHPPLLKTLGLDVNRITKIAFAPAGKPGLTILRVGDAWQLAEPFQLALKPAQVEALLLMPLTETRDMGTAPAASGTTQGGVDITTADGKTLHLDLGETLGAGVGALHSGNQAWRVSTHLHDLLADLPPLASLVHPQLDLPPAGRLAALTVDSGQSRLRVVRGKEGAKTGFTLDLPGAPRANAEAVALYCGELRKLSIAEIPRETASDAAFGFDKSPVTVLLEETGGAKTKLEVGGPTGPDLKRYFIRLTPPAGAPFVAAVETALVKNLPQGADFFRDWRVTTMKAADVRRVEISQAHKPTDACMLTRDAQGRIAFDEGTTPKPAFAVDQELGQTAFEALARAKPTGTGPALIPDGSPHLTLIDAFGRKEAFTLTHENGTCSIQREGDAESFIIPKAQVEVLLGGAEGLRNREIRWLPEGGEISAITLTQLPYALKFSFTKKDGEWVSADGQTIERPAVEALAAAMKHVRAEKFLPEADVKDAYSWPGITLTATIQTQTGPREATLRLTGNGKAGSTGTTWFHVQPAFTELLTGEFRPHQLLRLDPKQIDWIEVSGEDTGHPVRITRSAEGLFTVHGPGEKTIPQADCERLFDTFGTLTAPQPIGPLMQDVMMDASVTLHSTDGATHRVYLFGKRACFYSGTVRRDFRWIPTLPQGQALKSVLDQMNKPKQP